MHVPLSVGQNRRDAVLHAAREVAMPILVSAIHTIVVFFRVLFLRGVARNLFLPLALTIAFALSMSFFVSRTVTPLLCLLTLESGHGDDAPRGQGIAGAITRFLGAVDAAYAKALGWVLHHRVFTVVSIL